jgi:hypothetical protein
MKFPASQFSFDWCLQDFVTQYKDTVVCDVLGGSQDALAR